MNEGNALRTSAVYACVRVLAETVASLPLPLYRRLEPRGKERAPSHPLYRLLQERPNPEMTPFTFRETLQAHLLLWGNAYAEKELDRAGRVVALWPLLPDRTSPRRRDGIVSFGTRVKHETLEIPAERVLHIPGLGFDGLRGYSPIALAKQAIGLSLAAEEFGARFFGNSARPGGILRHPGHLGEKAQENLRSSWQVVQGGLSNAHRVAILEEGMEWQAMGLPPEEAQFLETRRFQLREIARLYRVPPHMIADMEGGASYSSIEQMSLEFVIHTIRPWLVRWEQTLNHALLTERERTEYFAEFLIEGLLRGDIQSRYQAYATARQWGWFSANDILELENRNPVEGGDVYLVPLNMVPADSVAELAPSSRELPSGADVEARALQAREQRTRRSLTSRRRQRSAYRRVFAQAADQVVRREVNAVRRQLKKSLGTRDAQNLRIWLEEFYATFPEQWVRALLPALLALAEVIHAEAADEVGAEEDFAGAVADFVRDYARSLGKRQVDSSLGQLLSILAAAAVADDVADALEERLAEWEAKRADKVAGRETVQLAEAVAVVTYREAGVRRLEWRTAGENCPLCAEMDGRTVGIEQPFMQPGDVLAPDGTRPLEAKQTYTHPPLHRGCDCGVVAAA